MALNKSLLIATMEHIERHPSQWNQERWGEVTECGTVACFAGWATMIDNPEATPPPDGEPWKVNGRYVEYHAQDILGLTGEQSAVLFSEYRTMGDLRALVDLFAETDGAATRDQMWQVA